MNMILLCKEQGNLKTLSENFKINMYMYVKNLNKKCLLSKFYIRTHTIKTIKLKDYIHIQVSKQRFLLTRMVNKLAIK